MWSYFLCLSPLLLGLNIVLVGVIFTYVLDQQESPAVRRQVRTQFQLGDVFWLFVYLQLAIGLVLVPFRESSVTTKGVLVLLAGTPVLLLWWSSVQWLSRGEVKSQARRSAFFGVLVPCALLIVVSWLPLCVLFLALMTAEDIDDGLRLLAVILGPVLAVALLPLAIHGLRRLALWILGKAVVKKRIDTFAGEPWEEPHAASSKETGER